MSGPMMEQNNCHDLFLLQANLNKSLMASTTLEYSVHKSVGTEAKKSSQPDICLLTEPSCTMSSNQIINSIPQGFSAFAPRTETRTFKNDTGKWPRAAIIYKLSMKIWPIR